MYMYVYIIQLHYNAQMAHTLYFILGTSLNSKQINYVHTVTAHHFRNWFLFKCKTESFNVVNSITQYSSPSSKPFTQRKSNGTLKMQVKRSQATMWIYFDMLCFNGINNLKHFNAVYHEMSKLIYQNGKPWVEIG